MIVIDMDMPKSCFGCSTKVNPEERRCNIDGHLFKETLGVCTSRRDKACPLKCDIKDIKAEIYKTLDEREPVCIAQNNFEGGLMVALDIIDKHTKGDNE